MSILALVISVLLQLDADGGAVVNEKWSIDVSEGTELYLNRTNLGDISISKFSVSENGRKFDFDDRWDSSRSLGAKAHRCGVVSKKDGCELCWGIGSYGHHDFDVSYRMSNVVRSLKDYDALHLQLVSPGITPYPDKVDIRIDGPVGLSEENTGLWGFGFEGTSGFKNGGVVFSSTERFKKNWSAIVLLRFEKGIFKPAVSSDKNFEDVLEVAMEGGKFRDDPEDGLSRGDIFKIVLIFIAFLASLFGGARAKRVNKKKILGCKEKEVGWQRDIPCGGSLLKSDYILGRLGENGRSGVAAAMILRMIQRDILSVGRDRHDEVEISFAPDASLDILSESEKELYDMMKEASGSDAILQKNEFKRWSKRHMSRVSKWVTTTKNEGENLMREDGALSGSKFTESGQKDARDVVGFRKFLQDFTIIDERRSVEVILWQDLLVFAALFGIADKVAKELREINPQAFETEFKGGFDTTWRTIRMTQILSVSITNAHAAHTSGSSRSGLGGYTSVGGGRGFSGGGFGGGVR